MLAGAQTKELDYTEVDPVFETGARFDANLEIALIPRRLKLNFGEEIRLNENFGHLQKSYTSAGADVTILPWLKTGADYSFILNNSSTKGWIVRHRGSVSLVQSVDFGRWKFSLRERFQATYKAYDVNPYQTPKTELSLKARLKIAYDLPGSPFEPYILGEPRFLLNGVRPGAFVYYEENGRWGNPSPEYTDVYFNRLRLKAGTRYKASKNNEFNFFVVADLCYDLDIDFNAQGLQKKDDISGNYTDYLFVKNSYFIGIGVSYTFKI